MRHIVAEIGIDRPYRQSNEKSNVQCPLQIPTPLMDSCPESLQEGPSIGDDKATDNPRNCHLKKLMTD